MGRGLVNGMLFAGKTLLNRYHSISGVVSKLEVIWRGTLAGDDPALEIYDNVELYQLNWTQTFITTFKLH